MRTLLFLLVGFLLLASSLLLGKLFSSNYPGAAFAATLVFVVLWLGISGAFSCSSRFRAELPSRQRQVNQRMWFMSS
jgi:membrane protein implicated in regulation of membrane protease activity